VSAQKTLQVYPLWGRDLPGGSHCSGTLARVDASQGCVSKDTVWWARLSHAGRCDNTCGGWC
jgi:hypothetical protein